MAELPDLHYAEPAYATEVDWLLCDALDRLSHPDGESCYLRMSTRPIDQEPFAAALDRYGRPTSANTFSMVATDSSTAHTTAARV